MATFRDYLEEETVFLPISDFPRALLEAEDYDISEGSFTFSTRRTPERSYTLLEVTVTNGETYYVIAHDEEEWVAYVEIEDYVAENFDSDLSYYDLDV